MELIILILCALKFKLEKSKKTVEIEDEFDVKDWGLQILNKERLGPGFILLWLNVGYIANIFKVT